MEPKKETPESQPSTHSSGSNHGASPTQRGISSIRVRTQSRVARNQFEPGTILKSRYRIGEVIGVGGFGVVYEGFDQSQDDKLIAIKTLKHNIADYEQASERFTREIDLCSRLSSPHAVKIFDCGMANDETLFYVMEYLEGFSLESFIADREKMTFCDLKNVYLQILDALGEAHSKNIIHRDLKPANIWLINQSEQSRDFYVKLLDFGIAKSLDPDDQAGKKMTQTGAWTGSPAYMSPEHLTGKPLAPTTDIFSLGLIAIEALTGYQAVEGDSPMDIAMSIVSANSDIFIDDWILDTSIGAIISKCVQKDPMLRYRDGKELAEALSQLDDNELKNEYASAKMRKLTSSGRRTSLNVNINSVADTQLGESEAVIRLRREKQMQAMIIVGIVICIVVIGIVIFVNLYVNKLLDAAKPTAEDIDTIHAKIQEQIDQGVKNQETKRRAQMSITRSMAIGMAWGIGCEQTCMDLKKKDNHINDVDSDPEPVNINNPEPINNNNPEIIDDKPKDNEAQNPKTEPANVQVNSGKTSNPGHKKKKNKPPSWNVDTLIK